MSTSSTALRLEQLRQQMAKEKIDAYLILSSDPHLSEYLPEHWQSRTWLSGFGGSAGTLLITLETAALWTDSRYWVQAEHDLRHTGIQLMKQGAAEVPEPQDFLLAYAAAGGVLCFDAQIMPWAAYQEWQRWAGQHDWQLQTTDKLLTRIWIERPVLPQHPIYAHDSAFLCRTRQDNLQQVRQVMIQQGVQWHLLSSLDDIAWLLGLRGADVAYNPVFMAHLLVGLDDAYLFIDLAKVDNTLKQALALDNIYLQPYTHLAQKLRSLSAQQKLLFDPQAVTAGVVLAAEQLPWVLAENPSTLAKACKNEQELAHIRATMVQDGIALCEFFSWFEGEVQQRPVSELEVDEQLTAARARRPHFVSSSFATIAGFNANGAMPHYQATAEQFAWIEGDGLLLIDSGGQYLGGTTDITRVVPVGVATAEQKYDYTLVLKAMINLTQAVFPQGVSGQHLDAIARMPLWQAQVDYGHGTGHGVGYFLNVHEGPQSISWRMRPGRSPVALRPGMVTSNEPALYRSGQWGIRIENLIAVQPAGANEFGSFLCFETLTLCPIDTRCVLVELLTDEELRWLNAYHAQVREQLAPHLEKDALQWLLVRTEPLEK